MPTVSFREPSHSVAFSSLSSNLLLHPWAPPLNQKWAPYFPRQWWPSEESSFSFGPPIFLNSHPSLFLSLLPQCKKSPSSCPRLTPPHPSMTHFRDIFFSPQLLPFLSFSSTGSLPAAVKQFTLQLHRCFYLPHPTSFFSPLNFLNSPASQTHCPLEPSLLNSIYAPPFLMSHSPLSPL